MSNFYDTYIESIPSPKEYQKKMFQETINNYFKFATTYHGMNEDILEEIKFGSSIFDTTTFKPIEARINQIIDSKTGERVNDNYRQMLFKDLLYKPKLGQRYIFENNVWIVYDTSNIKTDTSSCYVKRCNNVIGMQDKYGNIHYEPCVFENANTRSNQFQSRSLNVVYGKFIIYFQLNERTKFINENFRVIVGNQVYRIVNEAEYSRLETFNKDNITYGMYYLDFDGKNEYDNFELSIADYKVFDYKINVIKKITGIINNIEELKTEIFLNNEIVNFDYEYISLNQDIVEVYKKDNKWYCKFKQIGECSLKCFLKNRIDIYEIIEISVKKNIENNYIDLINPNINYIKINETQEYTICEYNNGIKTNTNFTIESNGIDNKCYKLKIIDGNTFTVQNLKNNVKELLHIKCINNKNKKETSIYIEMGGLF